MRGRSVLGKDTREALESVFLRELFKSLNTSGIHYAVMRNYVQLPLSAGGSDLDILIPYSEKCKFKNILFNSILRTGGVSIGYTETIGMIKVFVVGYVNDYLNGWWGLRIDVNIGYMYKGYDLLSKYYIENNNIKYRDIKVLDTGIAAVIGVLKEVLNNNKLPLRYQHDAVKAVKNDWRGLCGALAPIGDRGLEILRGLILSGQDSMHNPSLGCALRWALFWKTIKNSPFTFFQGRILSEWSKVQRFLRPSGVVVALLGVDGVGKSTVINSIAPVLKDATHGAFSIEHLRPGLFPPLARIKGKRAKILGPVLDPHGSTPSGTLGSIVRLIYLAMDYVLGYWLLLRPQLAKCPAVFLFDRYFYDMILDPRRFRIGIEGRKLAWFLRFLPKPDIVVCLHASPEVIMSRKQELPRDEVIRQIEALRELASNEPRAILISTEGNIEEVRDRVLMALKDIFGKRTGNGC